MNKNKKQELTQGERLAQVLVSAGEQPYGIPENWLWAKGNFCLQPMTTKKPSGETFRYIDIDAIDNDNQAVTFPKELLVKDAPSRASREVREGDTLFSMVRPYLRNIAYVDYELADCVASTGFFVCRPSNEINGRYMYALMTSSYVVDGLNAFMKGDNSPSIRQENILNFAFPVPPLPEQHRIVARIESLFDKLDRAKALVQSALESFETRRAAILHKAFTGELTAKWREKNGIELENWEEKPLSELCSSFQYGTSKKSDKSGEVVVLRMGNLQGGEIDWGDLAYSNDEDDNEKYKLSSGDVLFNRTNSPEHVGKTSVYRGNVSAIFAGYLIRINYDESLDCYYLNYVMNSQRAREYCRQVKTDGVNQSNINAKKLAAFTIPHCGVDEQQEIVRILDDLLEKEQTAQELTNTIEKIDHMKKAILARAFRGELGTNDPSEESAVELLKESIKV